jgi:hypothetical protein
LPVPQPLRLLLQSLRVDDIVYESSIGTPIRSLPPSCNGIRPPTRENAIHTPIQQIAGIDGTVVARHQPEIVIPSVPFNQFQISTSPVRFVLDKTPTDAISTISPSTNHIRAISGGDIGGLEGNDDKPERQTVTATNNRGSSDADGRHHLASGFLK